MAAAAAAAAACDPGLLQRGLPGAQSGEAIPCHATDCRAHQEGLARYAAGQQQPLLQPPQESPHPCQPAQYTGQPYYQDPPVLEPSGGGDGGGARLSNAATTADADVAYPPQPTLSLHQSAQASGPVESELMCPAPPGGGGASIPPAGTAGRVRGREGSEDGSTAGGAHWP
ncbi:hypothetical protein Vretifemale_14635, partial [Volvox reticuliferus]